MTQLSPQQQKAMRLQTRRDMEQKARDRLQKKRKLEMKGKKKVNGRYYDEKAICASKHDALKIEREVREETGGLPTHVAMTSKGWTVFALAAG